MNNFSIENLVSFYDSIAGKCKILIKFTQKPDIKTITSNNIKVNGGDFHFDFSKNDIKIDGNEVSIFIESVKFNETYSIRISNVTSVFGENLDNVIDTTVCFKSTVAGIPEIEYPFDKTILYSTIISIGLSNDCINKNVEILVDNNTGFISPKVIDLKNMRVNTISFDCETISTFYIKCRYYNIDNGKKEYGAFSETTFFKIKSSEENVNSDSTFDSPSIDESLIYNANIVYSYYDDKDKTINVEFDKPIRDVDITSIKSSSLSSKRRKREKYSGYSILDEMVSIEMGDEYLQNDCELTVSMSVELMSSHKIDIKAFSVYNVSPLYSTIDDVLSIIPLSLSDSITDKDILLTIQENSMLADFILLQNNIKSNDNIILFSKQYTKYKSAATLLLKGFYDTSSEIEGSVDNVSFSKSKSPEISDILDFLELKAKEAEDNMTGMKTYGIVKSKSTILFKDKVPVKRFRERW